MYKSKLVSYYLSKGFVILGKASIALNNVPLRVKNGIHDTNMFDSDSIISCSTVLKNIYPSGTLLGEFTSEYYHDKNYTSGLLFQKYTASDVDKIYHLSIINEWKTNT